MPDDEITEARGDWPEQVSPSPPSESDGASTSFEALRSEARHIYGAQADAYHEGRPDYPPQIYEMLVARCGLQRGTRVVEIGPGTGQLTQHLLAVGAEVTAVEPDSGFVTYLATALPEVHLHHTTFEESSLESSSADLVAAATSFHWLDQPRALGEVRRILRPGGWLAVWWTIFSDPTRPDPLIEEATGILGLDPGNQRTGTSFQLDEATRVHDLVHFGGLVDVQATRIHWEVPLNASQTRALFASQMSLRRLAEERRLHVLDTLSGLVDDRFAGIDHRPLLTIAYFGQMPTQVDQAHG